MCDTTHNKRNYFSIQGELESQLLQANPILEGKKKRTQICKILSFDDFVIKHLVMVKQLKMIIHHDLVNLFVLILIHRVLLLVH